MLGPLHTMAEGREGVVSTNEIVRNQEFDLSTLHIEAQSSSYMAVLFGPNFDQNDGLSKKEVWVERE